MESSVEVLKKKLKVEWPYDPTGSLLGVYSQENKKY